jgi:hypothetical protein
MKNLEIQILLRLHGLSHVKEYLKLDVKEKGDLVLLKYRQLEADWSKTALLDCRGIILDRSKDWKLVSYPYEKFFNLGEGYCAQIDWDTAKIFQKVDGSLINIYWYNNTWNVQTSGVIDAKAQTNHATMLFDELFWMSVVAMYGSKDEFISRLDVNYNYMFELCTPWNIVVTPHEDYTVKLHGVRDMRTLKYVDLVESNLEKVKQYDLSSVDEMLAQFEHMTWDEEGFIIVDANYNRAKCKNPKYVAVHHVKSGVSPYEIINVIKTNEIDEFCVYFKEKTEFILDLKSKWDNVENELKTYYNSIKDITDQKQFALKVLSDLEKSYTGIMFAMRSGNIITIHEGMCKLDNRFWYKKFLVDQ